MRVLQVAAFLAVLCFSTIDAQSPTPCTNSANCFGHASTVSGNSQTGCICTCRNQWYGGQCQACPPGVDPSQDCGACLPGYVNYPFCALGCTIAGNCSGHASAVQGDSQTGCRCACSNQWMGLNCQYCPNGVDPSQDCGKCLPGYEGYPFCGQTCTSAGNCSGHASTVSGDSLTGCQCQCRNAWIGAQCQFCPSGFDASKDCGECLPGYEGYPFCGQTCTNNGNCSGHATAVAGDAQTGCQCTCANAWMGSQCQFCPNGVDASKNCGRCVPGYQDYPFCSLSCTISGNCSTHATAVTGDSQTGCQCTCRNQWVGGQCNYCPPQYDSQNDCGSCSTGFQDYPFCYGADEPHPRHHRIAKSFNRAHQGRGHHRN